MVPVTRIRQISKYEVACDKCGIIGVRNHIREAEMLKKVHTTQHMREETKK